MLFRSKTGAGMMECKAALTEAGGNMEEAITLLRKRGLAQAAKRAGRATAQGIIGSYIHMGGKIGVLKPGAVGDVVIWDGDPLEVSSGAVRVFIDGVEQPLDNHRTRLRDRYRDLDESDLPKAFDW